MEVEILNKTVDDTGILDFIFPAGCNRKVFENGLLRQYFYYNYSYPGTLYLREEYGLVSRGCSFVVYILQESGHNLDVVSCTRHTRTETVNVQDGYTYIRLPALAEKIEKWEYSIGGLAVKCQSLKVVCGVGRRRREILQVKRDLCYRLNAPVDRTVEYYLEGTGIYGISCIQERMNPG